MLNRLVMVEKSVLFLAIFFSSGVVVSQAKVQALLAENMSNPICLDMPKPHFSWQLVSRKRNIIQTAYEVIVTSGKSDFVVNQELFTAGDEKLPDIKFLLKTGLKKTPITTLNIFDIG